MNMTICLLSKTTSNLTNKNMDNLIEKLLYQDSWWCPREFKPIVFSVGIGVVIVIGIIISLLMNHSSLDK